MKIPCDLYFMKNGTRGELIGSFEDIEAAQAYDEEVCTKIPFANEPKDEKLILPCPVCNNEDLVVHQLPPNLGDYASICCKKCGLTVKSKAVGERYEHVYGDYYRKKPAKYATDVVIELWNAMAMNY